MTDKVAKLINTQINKEFYSAYLYLEFSNYYASEGLDGFENWYKIQAQEERDHALLFYQYLQNNSIKVTFEAIDKPKCDLKEQDVYKRQVPRCSRRIHTDVISLRFDIPSDKLLPPESILVSDTALPHKPTLHPSGRRI